MVSWNVRQSQPLQRLELLFIASSGAHSYPQSKAEPSKCREHVVVFVFVSQSPIYYFLRCRLEEPPSVLCENYSTFFVLPSQFDRRMHPSRATPPRSSGEKSNPPRPKPKRPAPTVALQSGSQDQEDAARTRRQQESSVTTPGRSPVLIQSPPPAAAAGNEEPSVSNASITEFNERQQQATDARSAATGTPASNGTPNATPIHQRHASTSSAASSGVKFQTPEKTTPSGSPVASPASSFRYRGRTKTIALGTSLPTDLVRDFRAKYPETRSQRELDKMERLAKISEIQNRHSLKARRLAGLYSDDSPLEQEPLACQLCEEDLIVSDQIRKVIGGSQLASVAAKANSAMRCEAVMWCHDCHPLQLFCEKCCFEFHRSVPHFLNHHRLTLVSSVFNVGSSFDDVLSSDGEGSRSPSRAQQQSENASPAPASPMSSPLRSFVEFSDRLAAARRTVGRIKQAERRCDDKSVPQTALRVMQMAIKLEELRTEDVRLREKRQAELAQQLTENRQESFREQLMGKAGVRQW